MCKNYYFILLLLFSFAKVHSQTNDSSFSSSVLSSVVLRNAENESNFHINTPVQKPVLFIFLSPECPLCKNYSTTLNLLYQEYNKEIVFYGIIPGKTYSVKDVNNFKTAYHISFPLLIDTNKQLSNYLQATTTPGTILLSENYNLIYKGAIDNWVADLGKQRARPTQNYLEEAIEKTIRRDAVTLKRTKAVGCKINDF